ncbi:hypothetical protein L873DRAFT_1847521 [Choiromyces venosus 120613-1]|uniref:Myb/SANT-like domain-containing protein n=1 Tax=Choiromyces venosus 120613-1 TaxID=1336337 RepID=A0A3N4J6E8_9PEZI|nr:hypothetical protein L873DRAFT_1847521 [Choiromyces venosus 120613-1]
MASGKAKWINKMVHAMLSSLLQSAKEGKFEENSFKKEAWQKACIATNTVYGTKLDFTQLVEAMAEKVEQQAGSKDSSTSATPAAPDMVFESGGNDESTRMEIIMTLEGYTQGKSRGKQEYIYSNLSTSHL